MSKVSALAVFGATPRFAHPIANGQRNFPAWAQYRAIFGDIFERQYYTNQGPLTQELERRLAERLNVRHAMCVTNEFIGLVSAGQALAVHGNVVMPAHSLFASQQSLSWTEAGPLFCDVDSQTGMMTPDLVAPLLSRNPVSAILGVNPWGDACDVEGLQALADQNGIPLYLDSSHGFGCAISGRPIGSFGAIEVISFHSDNVIGAGEGGVVCTQRDDLAAFIRNARSSYGMGTLVFVPKTGNGRMSEAQAAVALFNLDHYAEYQRRNEQIFASFQVGLAGIPGLQLRIPSGVSRSNYQNLICLIDETLFGLRRDDLWRILRAENLLVGTGFDRSVHRSSGTLRPSRIGGLSHTDGYCSRTIELPMNRALGEDHVANIIDLLADIQINSGDIRQRLGEEA